ncbi:hypothetical protein MUK72_12905 [Halococcus dombrowskii]|uniref:Uncharacterized protein n=1 Tax=Halococcus dombrowskii TaxID=179637 RepID=A0AAV3SFA6_HALDO|nr:hypothetical protein [Halococcus dombrowskii]UOO94857.1 hypothetical protein MUK72_12905 [Halococcus dombrowskii]
MDRAPELAAFAAFVAALIPWSVSVSDGAFAQSIVVRFVFGAVELSFGARSLDMTRTAVPVTDVGSQYGGDLARLETLWLVAAALLVIALVLALALVVAGDRLLVGAFDPVRAMGALCLGMALVLSGAIWLLWQRTSPVPIPIGVIALFLFGVGLLTVDHTRDTRTSTGASG